MSVMKLNSKLNNINNETKEKNKRNSNNSKSLDLTYKINQGFKVPYKGKLLSTFRKQFIGKKNMENDIFNKDNFEINNQLQNTRTISYNLNNAKVYNTKEIKPSDQMIRMNDKKNFLPSEYFSIYNQKNKLVSTGSSREYIRRNYPYVKDNVSDLLKHKNILKNEDISFKINNNNFDILSKVKRYNWEN